MPGAGWETLQGQGRHAGEELPADAPELPQHYGGLVPGGRGEEENDQSDCEGWGGKIL